MQAYSSQYKLGSWYAGAGAIVELTTKAIGNNAEKSLFRTSTRTY